MKEMKKKEIVGAIHAAMLVTALGLTGCGGGGGNDPVALGTPNDGPANKNNTNVDPTTAPTTTVRGSSRA